MMTRTALAHIFAFDKRISSINCKYTTKHAECEHFQCIACGELVLPENHGVSRLLDGEFRGLVRANTVPSKHCVLQEASVPNKVKNANKIVQAPTTWEILWKNNYI